VNSLRPAGKTPAIWSPTCSRPLRDGTSFRAEAEALTAHEIELVVDEMRTSTVDDWVRRYGEPLPSTEDRVAADGCAMPTLSISGG
jgi:hypothetical protein